jgi:hypothetical protein
MGPIISTGIASVADLVKDVLDKVFPDPVEAAKVKLQLFQAQQQGVLAEADQAFQLQIEQIKTNAVAAAKQDITFRDGAGWVSVVGMGFIVLKSPIEWGAALVGHPISLPAVDSTTIWGILGPLLGLGAMHMNENVKNADHS